MHTNGNLTFEEVSNILKENVARFKTATPYNFSLEVNEHDSTFEFLLNRPFTETAYEQNVSHHIRYSQCMELQPGVIVGNVLSWIRQANRTLQGQATIMDQKHKDAVDYEMSVGEAVSKATLVRHEFDNWSVNQVFSLPGTYSKLANHVYYVSPSNNWYLPLSRIQFQDGALKESHIDGVHNEDLLLIVKDRLEGFQASEFACDENQKVLEAIDLALMHLYKRTHQRHRRNVEGTNVK